MLLFHALYHEQVNYSIDSFDTPGFITSLLQGQVCVQASNLGMLCLTAQPHYVNIAINKIPVNGTYRMDPEHQPIHKQILCSYLKMISEGERII
jgi:hypothetical protein